MLRVSLCTDKSSVDHFEEYIIVDPFLIVKHANQRSTNVYIPICTVYIYYVVYRVQGFIQDLSSGRDYSYL